MKTSSGAIKDSKFLDLQSDHQFLKKDFTERSQLLSSLARYFDREIPMEVCKMKHLILKTRYEGSLLLLYVTKTKLEV